jgi:hypothetical protein
MTAYGAGLTLSTTLSSTHLRAGLTGGIEQFRRVDVTYRMAIGHEGARKPSLASDSPWTPGRTTLSASANSTIL